MDLELSGKVAVVTGASKGIGLAIASALVDEGARVVAGARTSASLEGSRASPPSPSTCSRRTGPARLVQRAIERARPRRRAGQQRGRRAPAPGGLSRHQRRGVRLGHADELLRRACAPPARPITPMLEQGGGAIVNVASVNAFFQPDGGTIDYGAAKAALVNLTKSLSQEFGPRGIRINSRLARAGGHRPLARRRRRRRDGREGERRRRRHRARRRGRRASAGFATGRFTTPEEVATLVVVLASDRAPATSPAPTTSSTAG